MENNDATEGNRINISEGIILAIITAIAYLHVYLSELAYHQYFNIPKFLIRLSIEQILFRGFLFISLGISLFFGFSAWINYSYTKREKYVFSEPLAIELIFLSTLTTILFVGIGDTLDFLDPRYEDMILFATQFIIIWIAFYLIYKFMKNRKKLIEEKKIKKEPTIPILFLSLKLRPSIFDLILIVIILVFVFAISYENGYSNAQNTKDFYVTNTIPEKVILKNYSENLICASFDRKTNDVYNEFTILRVGDDPELTLSLERLGKLHPQELKPP